MSNTPAPDLPRTSFEEARRAAEAMALSELREFASPDVDSYLDSFTMAGDDCWFFFASNTVTAALEMQGRIIFTAYAVGKNGKQAFVYDLRPDMQKMQDYVSMWSLHARGEQEQAANALAAFLAKYY